MYADWMADMPIIINGENTSVPRQEINMQIEEAKEICKAIIKNMQEECEFDLNILKLNWNNRIAIDTVLNELEEQTEANKELNKVLIHFKAVINEMADYIKRFRYR